MSVTKRPRTRPDRAPICCGAHLFPPYALNTYTQSNGWILSWANQLQLRDIRRLLVFERHREQRSSDRARGNVSAVVSMKSEARRKPSIYKRLAGNTACRILGSATLDTASSSNGQKSFATCRIRFHPEGLGRH